MQPGRTTFKLSPTTLLRGGSNCCRPVLTHDAAFAHRGQRQLPLRLGSVLRVDVHDERFGAVARFRQAQARRAHYHGVASAGGAGWLASLGFVIGPRLPRRRDEHPSVEGARP